MYEEEMYEEEISGGGDDGQPHEDDKGWMTHGLWVIFLPPLRQTAGVGGSEGRPRLRQIADREGDGGRR